VQLVGRADPRGSEEYNEKLGLERAERVKSYLVGQGVEPGRVLTKSLGEKDASPSPADWPNDRHVEVGLAP
jgi:OmpA-OmpF porin, OOP family